MSTITKAASEGVKFNDVHKMLQHFKNFNFMKYTTNGMILGYNGENVKQSIHNEWLMSNSVMCDEPSFISSCLKRAELKSAYNAVKSLVKHLPCGIISSCAIDKSADGSPPPENSNASDIIENCFKEKHGLQLQRYIICESHTSDNLFYKLQRDRQKWWKKFSASPGQFTLSQLFNSDDCQYVEIHVQFPWGTVPVETIKLLPNYLEHDEQTGGETQKPLHVVSSATILENTTLALICDAYEGPEETGREVLRFHRKLAPYKVAFSAISSTPDEERNLKDLALLLTKQIRKNYNSVLLLPDMCTSPLEQQIVRNDSIGIPYTVILTEKTLKTGLLEIRSRDTTLKEQSHVGSLAPYVEKLMKNY